MTDAELATWQSGWKPGTDKHILAEKEWQRRIAVRQLREQFKLEERIANGNRWWSIAVAAIGVIGTLSGAWLADRLSSSHQATSQQAQTQTASPAASQQTQSSSSATSARSSTTAQPEKKAK